MKILLQKVLSASVHSEGELLGSIGQGYLLLVGIAPTDQDEQLQWCARKVLSLKLFGDQTVRDEGRSILAISQFTLFADVRKGAKPSWSGAAPPQQAQILYQRFVDLLRESIPGRVAQGRFGADMQVALVNDGPISFLVEK